MKITAMIVLIDNILNIWCSGNVFAIESYLIQEDNIKIEQLQQMGIGCFKGEEVSIKENVSAEEAKSIIKNDYYGQNISEPIKTIFKGRKVWEVKYIVEIGGKGYSYVLYVDVETAEVYAPY